MSIPQPNNDMPEWLTIADVLPPIDYYTVKDDLHAITRDDLITIIDNIVSDTTIDLYHRKLIVAIITGTANARRQLNAIARGRQ